MDPATSVHSVLDEEAGHTAFTSDGEYIEYRDGERIGDTMRAEGIVCERNDPLINKP